MKALVISILCILIRMELVSVIEVGVSGARSPNLDIPPGEFYESGLNELTPIGVRQQYLLGFYHKQTWSRLFLDSNYNEYQVYVRSINTNSSIMSCYAHTMGLYKVNSAETLTPAQIRLARPPVFNDSIFPYLETILGSYPLPYKLYPIPTHVFNPEIDPLAVDICPKANKLISEEYLASTEVDQLMKDYSDSINDVKTTYSFPDALVGKLMLPEIIYDIYAAHFDSRALGLHPVTALRMLELGNKMAPYAYCGKLDSSSCKLLAHNLNAYIIDIADDIVYDYTHKAKEERRCYTLLMTSDKMFVALLKSWGYMMDKMVPPASFLLISISKKDEHEATQASDFTIKVTLSTEKGKAPMNLPICTNGECDMPTYLSNMEKVLIKTTNITKECSITN